MSRRYLVVYEKAPGNYAASLPDVPGCIALGETIEETRRLLNEGLQQHFEGMLEDGDEIPEPSASSVDFAGEDIEHNVEYCVVEWLDIDIRVAPDEPTISAAGSQVKD